MTPNPVRREPGSTPSTRTLALDSATVMETVVEPSSPDLPTPARPPGVATLGSNPRQDFVRYLGIGVNVPHVIEVFERFQELHHQFASRVRQGRGERGTLGYLRRRGDETPLHQD